MNLVRFQRTHVTIQQVTRHSHSTKKDRVILIWFDPTSWGNYYREAAAGFCHLSCINNIYWSLCCSSCACTRWRHSQFTGCSVWLSVPAASVHTSDCYANSRLLRFLVLCNGRSQSYLLCVKQAVNNSSVHLHPQSTRPMKNQALCITKNVDK